MNEHCCKQTITKQCGVTNNSAMQWYGAQSHDDHKQETKEEEKEEEEEEEEEEEKEEEEEEEEEELPQIQ